MGAMQALQGDVSFTRRPGVCKLYQLAAGLIGLGVH
jgi:hypothetical protein